jgi:hypothetical protein
VLTWKKSSFSTGTSDCIELAWCGALRDSKNSDGPALRVELSGLLAAVKAGSLPRC